MHLKRFAISALTVALWVSDAGALNFPTGLAAKGEAVSEPNALKLLPAGAVFYSRLNLTRISGLGDIYGLFEQIPAEQRDAVLNAARALSVDGKADIKNLGAIIGLREGAPIWMALGQPATKSVNGYEKHVAKLKGNYLTGKVKKTLAETPPPAQISAYLRMAPGLFVRHTVVLPTSAAPGMTKLIGLATAQGMAIPHADAAAAATALEQKGFSAQDAKAAAKKVITSKQGKVIGVFMPAPMSLVQLIDTGEFTVVHAVHPLNQTTDAKGLVAHLTARGKTAKLKWGSSDDAASIIVDDMTGETFAGQVVLGKEAMTLARMNDAMDLARRLNMGEPSDPQKIRKSIYDAFKKSDRACQKLFRLKPMVKDAAFTVHQLDRGVRLSLAVGLGKKLIGKFAAPEAGLDFAKATDGAAVALYAATDQKNLSKAVKVPSLLKDPKKAMQQYMMCPSNQLMVAAAGQLPAISVSAQKLAPPQQQPPLPESLFASIFVPDKPTASAAGAAAQPPVPKALGTLAFASSKDLTAALGMATTMLGLPLLPTEEKVKVADEELTVSKAGPPELGVKIASGDKAPWLLASVGGANLSTLAAAIGDKKSTSPLWLLVDFKQALALSTVYGSMDPSGGQANAAMAGAAPKVLEHFTQLAVDGRGQGGALVVDVTLWK